jgi:hypothetical protein
LTSLIDACPWLATVSDRQRLPVASCTPAHQLRHPLTWRQRFTGGLDITGLGRCRTGLSCTCMAICVAQCPTAPPVNLCSSHLSGSSRPASPTCTHGGAEPLLLSHANHMCRLPNGSAVPAARHNAVLCCAVTIMLSLTCLICLVWLVVVPVDLQMEAYLKASRFRQTIEQHKRAMGGGNAMGPTPAGQVLQVGGWR